MKLIVEYEVTWRDLNSMTMKEYYNKFYKKDGFLFDEEAEAIYYEIDTPFMPLEGQRVGSKFGICIVKYSYLDLDLDSDNYFNRSRIVINHE